MFNHLLLDSPQTRFSHISLFGVFCVLCIFLRIKFRASSDITYSRRREGGERKAEEYSEHRQLIIRASSDNSYSQERDGGSVYFSQLRSIPLFLKKQNKGKNPSFNKIPSRAEAHIENKTSFNEIPQPFL